MILILFSKTALMCLRWEKVIVDYKIRGAAITVAWPTVYRPVADRSNCGRAIA